MKDKDLSKKMSLDIDEMEEGLLEISKQFLNPSSFYYSPGQVISSEDAIVLLGRELNDSQLERARQNDPNFQNIGINPILIDSKKPEDSKIYLSTMIEQDYFKLSFNNKKTIDTVAIGFGMNPNYFYTENKKLAITKEEKVNYANNYRFRWYYMF